MVVFGRIRGRAMQKKYRVTEGSPQNPEPEHTEIETNLARTGRISRNEFT
jgi:hypothetical protein